MDLAVLSTLRRTVSALPSPQHLGVLHLGIDIGEAVFVQLEIG